MFLRKAKRREPVPVTMSGVRMGEKLLQIGIDASGVAGTIAAKVGLSGSAAAAVTDEGAATRARAAAIEAGVLMEVQVAPLDRLPFADAAFDVVVVHSQQGLLSSIEAAGRPAAAREWCRVLRQGGRIVTIEPGTRTGLSAMFTRGAGSNTAYADAGGAVGLLESGGFKPVRQVGDLEGIKFTEGLKS